MDGGDNAHIRIGHAERDATIDRLREAAGDGRLTLDELDERIAAALEATTRSDLREILANLVVAMEVEAVLHPGLVQARPDEPGWSWETPLELTAKWDDVVRSGPWEVPPFLEVQAVAANVKLNFVDARVSTERINVVVNRGAGNAVFIVPDGWGADLIHIAAGMGRIKSVVPPRSARGLPTLMLRGQGGMGNVTVRYPNRFDEWRRQRWLAAGGGILIKN